MNQKYFYFGIRTTQEVVDATGRSRNEQVVRWAPKSYQSAAEAATAAANAMSTRLGLSFFVQGFEKELDIDAATGVSKGFKAPQP